VGAKPAFAPACALRHSSRRILRRPSALDSAEVYILSASSRPQCVFRAKFVQGLRRAFRRGKLVFSGTLSQLAEPDRFSAFLDLLFRQKWVVYAKPAFGSPGCVLRYLGRYTHRVAISNHRLLAFDGEQVTFRWKDYAHGKKQRKMTVSGVEFLRRFSQHILPRGFVRIRQFGFLTNRRRSAALALARQLLGAAVGAAAPVARANAVLPTWRCPYC